MAEVESAVLVRGVGVFGPAPPPQGWAAESSSNGLAYLSSSFQNAECFAPRPRARLPPFSLVWDGNAKPVTLFPRSLSDPVPSLSSRRDANGVLVCPEARTCASDKAQPDSSAKGPVQRGSSANETRLLASKSSASSCLWQTTGPGPGPGPGPGGPESWWPRPRPGLHLFADYVGV